MVSISFDNEQFIEAAVAEGRFKNRDEALNEAVRMLREKSERNGPEHLADPIIAEQWRVEFRAWLESHTDIQAVADDSRESIYAGCGE